MRENQANKTRVAMNDRTEKSLSMGTPYVDPPLTLSFS